MNKRGRRKEVEKALRGSMQTQVWQDKPYTAVKVVVVEEVGTARRLRWAYGFSKVRHPDEWDARYGIELAVDKAVAKIAKDIVGEAEEEEVRYDEAAKVDMDWMGLQREAQEKGVTLFFRGDESFRMIFGCFEPFGPNYQMIMGPRDEMYEKLRGWLDRYPDAEIGEIWV